MLIRALCFGLFVAVSNGISLQSNFPDLEVSFREIAEQDAQEAFDAQTGVSTMTRVFEELGTQATVKATNDPFKSGNTKLWFISVQVRVGNASHTDFLSTFQKGYNNVFEEFEGNLGVKLMSKVQVLQQWLEKKAKHAPKDMVLYVDQDTVYAGCSEKQFLGDVNMILEKSGADIVLGAELNCAPLAVWAKGSYHCKHRTDVNQPNRLLQYEPDADYSRTVYPEVPQWAEVEYGLNDQTWRPYSNDPESLHSDQTNPKPRFLNSGLVVGRAEDVSKVFSHVLHKYRSPYGSNWFNDQHAINHLYYATVDDTLEKGMPKLTLDFGTRLIFNMHGTNLAHPPWLMRKDGTAQNRISGKDVCFIHGNGDRSHKRAFARVRQTIMKKRPDLMMENFH